ncbi:MAG TPA: hypothetical protein VJT50_04740 [Pyrinomonadaceae bacterium]|nr:hypothetical protein [Pyrinomonadaceae bacterium]
MTDEERQRAMDFIAEQTAKNAIGIEKLLESQRTAEHRMELTERLLECDQYRLDRDERILKLMIRAGRRERSIRVGADESLAIALADLAEAQKRTEASIVHTDKRLDALIDIVRDNKNGRTS